MMRSLYISFVAIVLFASCRTPEKLSKSYYVLHKNELKTIIETYNQLYEIKPFILGFSDARYRKYSLEVSTDTVRYVYNTSIMQFSVADSIKRFGFDSSHMKKLGQMMRKSKCICVARHFFYWDNKEYAANWLFFRQSGSGLFKERRYHVLIFFKDALPENARKEFIEQQKLEPLEDNVFYTVSNLFK